MFTSQTKAEALAAAIAHIKATTNLPAPVYTKAEIDACDVWSFATPHGLRTARMERNKDELQVRMIAASTAYFPPLPLHMAAKRRAIRELKTQRNPNAHIRWPVLRDALQFNLNRHI